MHSASGTQDTGKFVVQSFDHCGSPEVSHRCMRYEFDTLDAALVCARRIVDKSLKRTHNATRSPLEWYRHWAAFGDGVNVIGMGFDPHEYARRRIRELTRLESQNRSMGTGGSRRVPRERSSADQRAKRHHHY